MAKAQSKFKLFLAGARLRTLPLAIAPVLLGACSALSLQRFSLKLTLLALAVALFLQIGVNYSNDYSDGVRGTDAKRVGPMRLTGSGALAPKQVLAAALVSFAAAGMAGLAIVYLTQFWWLLAVGAACVIAAWFYTGGKKPYGYAGFGELAVFVFFGLVATVGTSYIQVRSLDQTSVLLGAAAGFFAVAVLMVNNLRDRKFDSEVGKNTLAVRVGEAWSKALFLVFLWLPFPTITLIAMVYPTAILGWFAVFLVGPATLIFAMAKSPKDLILVLKLSSYAALVFAAAELLAFSIQ